MGVGIKMSTGIEMVLEEAIKSINEGIETKTGVAKFLKITTYAFDKRAKEEGYVWNKEEKRYHKIKDENNDNLDSNFEGIINFENGVKNEIDVNNNSNFKTENEIKNSINSNIKNEIENKIDSNMNIGINSERNIQMEIEIKNGSNFNMKEMLPKASKPKFKPVTVHLREDINEAIDKFVEGEGKGAKQELINKMLEMILKENNLL